MVQNRTQNGQAIRDFSHLRGMSPDDLGKATDISTPHIRNLLNEARSANPDHLLLLARVLDVRVESIQRQDVRSRGTEHNGFALRDFRVIRGLTVPELAEKVNLSAPHIRNLEHEHRRANDAHLNRLASALGIHVASLRRASVTDRLLVPA